MVLLELGGQINDALSKITRGATVDDEAVDAMLKEISRALLVADVNVKLVKEFKDQVKMKIEMEESSQGKKKLIQTAVFNQLLALLDPGVTPYQPHKGKVNIIMTVGLQGSGKTTTCTKYALYYQKKGWKVGLVCADTFRAGAYDQLKQNAAKSRVQFYGSMTETDPVVIAREGVEKFKSEGYEIIIVDTSGRHKQEASLFDEMEQIASTTEPDDIIFVMDSTIGQAAHDQAAAFKSKVKVGSVIITKLDGHAKGGGALSAVAATKSPIVFVGTGEHFEDFKSFDPKSFLSQMLGMGDIQGLMGALQDAGIDHKSSIYQFDKNQGFTLRDMYEHLQNITKLGPMGKFMDMVPGMAGMFKGQEGDQQNKLRSFLCLMDSMCDKELDHPNAKKIMTPDRLKRIGRGAGKSENDVRDLLTAYTKFEEVIKKMGKMNFKQMMKDPTGGGRGGAGMQQQLAKAMNPQMLKQLGGQAGLQNMMKGLGGGGGPGGGGMPDMSQIAQMAKQMGGKGGLGNLASMMGGKGGGGMGALASMMGGKGGGGMGDLAKLMGGK